MEKTVASFRGMVVAPHYLAAQSGLNILRAGGNAIEAAVAAPRWVLGRTWGSLKIENDFPQEVLLTLLKKQGI